MLRGINFGARSQWTSSAFTQVGLQPGQPAPVRVMSGNVGFMPRYGSFGVTYIRQDNRDQTSAEILSASYSATVAKSAALIAFAVKPLTGEGALAAGLTLSLGFGERKSASVSAIGQRGANQGTVEFQQGLPPGAGTGYRLLAGGGSRGTRAEAGFAWQTNAGSYVVEAGHSDDRWGYRANARGGVALFDGRAFFARDLGESFGIAHVPGFADIGVYVNNQIVARTDAQGYAVLPRLLPYQSNMVRIDLTDLPLDLEVPVTHIDAVPYYRSGVSLKFPVQPAKGALITLVLEDGSALPVGARVSVIGRAEEFPVAERGEAYVTGLVKDNGLRATWRGQDCEVRVVLPDDGGPLPRVGPLTCRGVMR